MNQEAIEKLIEKYAEGLRLAQEGLRDAQEKGGGSYAIEVSKDRIRVYGEIHQALEQMYDALKELSEFRVTTHSMMLGSAEDLYLDTIKRMRNLAQRALNGEA